MLIVVGGIDFLYRIHPRLGLLGNSDAQLALMGEYKRSRSLREYWIAQGRVLFVLELQSKDDRVGWGSRE